MGLASVCEKFQQTSTYIGQVLVTDIMLATEDLNRVASTFLGHALCLAASSFDGLSDIRRKEVNKSWNSTNELLGMLNKDSLPGKLLYGNVENITSTYLNC